MRLTEKNNRELGRYTISAFVANYVMKIHNQTGRSLEDLMAEIGAPIVWTPVGNRESDVKIVASILVLASDRKTIFVHSPNTNPTPIEEVPYIFTEFSEVAHFLSEKNLIPEHYDEDEISDVAEGEQVVYLPNIDDIFEHAVYLPKFEDEEDKDEIDIEIVMMVVIDFN